jgi:crotonobetaine/carnitine-CoA ligase
MKYAYEVVEERAADTPDKHFLQFEERAVTFGDLNRNTNRAANGLAGLGCGAQTGISIMMPNSPEWLYVYLAVQKIGAYAVPINTGLKADGLAYIIDHSDSTVVFIDHSYKETFEKVRPDLKRLEHVIVDTTEAPADFELPDGAITLASLMEADDTNPEMPSDPEGMSVLMYTSGTTGLPKGVVMRYKALDMEMFTMFSQLMYSEDDVLYTCLPLFHANALILTVIRALGVGAKVGLCRRFSASRFWDDIRKYKATSFNALGAMIPILMKQPERDNDTDNAIRLVMSAACPAHLWKEFEKRYGVTIWEGYGAVDGAGFSLFNAGNAPVGSMGKPPEGTVARVVDEENNEMPTGEVGELVFKIDVAEMRKVEYYKNEEASNKKIRDGWLHTGDLVYADKEGHFYFVDRNTDSMRRRGENISSTEVEEAITKHPAVVECAAYGVPSDLGEDDVMIAVVLQPGESLDPKDLVEFCSDKMAAFMIPRYIDIRDELPKTGTHRFKKVELKKQGVTPTTWDKEIEMPKKRK